MNDLVQIPRQAALGPSAWTANMPSLFATMFLIIFFVPQFFSQIPAMPEFLRPADLIGALCLGLYAVLRLTVKTQVNPAERLLLLFLLWAFIVSAAGIAVISMLPAHARHLGLEQALYPVRHLFIFGPGLLAFTLRPPKRGFVALGLLSFTAAALFIFFMTAAYTAGSEAYDAHQGLFEGGHAGARAWGLGAYFKRMGGIVGESGAYAFHALFVIAGLTVFAFLGGLRTLGYGLIAATPIWVLMVFATSQSRILLLTCAAFLLVILLDRRLIARTTAFYIAVAGGAALGAAAFAVAVFNLTLPINPLLVLRFQALMEGRVGGVQLTSGRLEHWSSVLEMLAYNPVLGYGYRNLGFLLDHAVENFFLQSLSEFGLVGFAIFIAFLAALWRAMGRDAPDASAETRRAKGVLRAMMAAAFVQWQVNDINTYWLTFPMLVALVVLVCNHTDSWRVPAPRREAALPGPAPPRARARPLPAMGG